MGALLCKKQLPIVLGREISFFGLQNFIFLAQGGLFSDLFVFSFTESFPNLLSSFYQWEKLTIPPSHLY